MRAVETEEEICLIFNDHRTLEFFPKTAWQEVKQELAQLIKDVDRDTSDDCLIPQLETAPNLYNWGKEMPCSSTRIGHFRVTKIVHLASYMTNYFYDLSILLTIK